MASPGLIAVASPVPKGANLTVLTQSLLARAPHNVKLAADTLCIKCVTMRIKLSGGVATTIAPDAPPNCTEYKPGVEADCVYQRENKIELGLEPSWAHRFEKDAPFGKMFVLVVHAIVDDKLVDVSFFYPKDAVGQVQPEITSIVSSIKKIAR